MMGNLWFVLLGKFVLQLMAHTNHFMEYAMFEIVCTNFSLVNCYTVFKKLVVLYKGKFLNFHLIRCVGV